MELPLNLELNRLNLQDTQKPLLKQIEERLKESAHIIENSPHDWKVKKAMEEQNFLFSILDYIELTEINIKDLEVNTAAEIGYSNFLNERLEEKNKLIHYLLPLALKNVSKWFKTGIFNLPNLKAA